MTASDEFLTPDDAARYICMSPQSLRRAVRRGDLRCARLGRLIRYRRSWLDNWADTQAPATADVPPERLMVGHDRVRRSVGGPATNS